MSLHQRVHVDEPRGRTPSRVKKDLRFRTEDDEAVLRTHPAAQVVPDRNRFRKEVGSVDETRDLLRRNAKENVALRVKGLGARENDEGRCKPATGCRNRAGGRAGKRDGESRRGQEQQKVVLAKIEPGTDAEEREKQQQSDAQTRLIGIS